MDAQPLGDQVLLDVRVRDDGTIENYYRRLTPSDCVILTKTIVAEPEAAPPPPPAA